MMRASDMWQLESAARQYEFFDDWIVACEAIILPALSNGLIEPPIIYELAYSYGIRKARHPLYQARLEAVEIINDLVHQDWFNLAMIAFNEGDKEAAAKLFVNNGWIKAPCCQGLVPCELHDAIRAEYCSRN